MKLTMGILVATYAVFGTGAMASAQTQADQIAAVKAASEKYQDVNVALAEGFTPDPSGLCISAVAEGLPPEWGSMGIHYLNMARLQVTAGVPKVAGEGTNTDFLEPSILLYEPQADGSLALVGVENLVFQDAWAAAGNTEPPSFAGQVWDAMADDVATAGDEAHGFQDHFDMHVWAFRENPAGAFIPFNPAVTCENQSG